jgi:type VI secretion system secreted protein VgrG
MIEQAHLEVEGLAVVRIVRVAGREGINELTRLEVDVLSDDAHVDVAGLVDKNAIVSLADASGQIGTFHLIVLGASHGGRFRGAERYRVSVGPEVGRLLYRVNHEAFQEKTTHEIVATLLERLGIPSSCVKWRLHGRYTKRTYTVQHGESDWSFISRLLADDGINYWFDYEQGDPILVFGDAPTSHDGIEGKSPAVPFQDGSGMNLSSFAIHRLERSWSIAPTKVFLRDVDVQHPETPVDAVAGDGALEVFEYPSNVLIPEAAQARAKVRLEQHQRNSSTLAAESGNARLRPGRVVEIVGAADDCFSGKFLITSVEHEVAQAAQGEAGAVPYRNRVTLVPFGNQVAHRPAVPTTRPVVEGFENGIVTGPAGEEIHVDDLGRIKVRLFWDRSGIRDDKSSRWVRSLQMNVVAPQMLPRVGWEVPVSYENGDPDRPFVLGRLYNGGAPPPYPLPGKSATSTLQSATSPKDGTTQEIRLGDSAGSEQAFVHATKDQTVTVGGAHTVKVAGNRSDDVQKSQSLSVDSAQSVSIGGNQKVVVGANGAIVVKGARAETVGGNESIGVTGTYGIAVKGAYVELVGGLYSLRCNQANATIQGAFTQIVGAALSTTAGLGSNQSVAGARTEVVGGARSFAAAGAYADGTTGLKRITAAAANETANADVAWKAGARVQLKAGGAMFIEGGGKVVFEATTISVKAATLSAKGGTSMKLAGAVKASATVKLAAPTVTKTDKVKVEG